MDDMRLDRRAYQGAPKIRNGHWPDDIDMTAAPHWSWDKAQVIRRESLAATLRKIKRQKIVDTM
jgi:hypothetical protein